MLKAAEYIEPERREPFQRGVLALAVVVPVALLWSLIFAALFMGEGENDPSATSMQTYGP